MRRCLSIGMEDRFLAQWEENAELFARLIAGEGTPHHKYILNPCVEHLIGDVGGKDLLDAGCGEGYLSRFYAAKGARVTGVDISQRLVTTAQKTTSKLDLDVEFRVGDVCDLSESEIGTFDIVLSNLVLLNIPCWKDALREFHRVLKSGGILVFSVVHPAFNFYGPGAWEMGEKDAETGRRRGLFFKVDNYFDEREYKRYWRTRTGEQFPLPFSFFHRTISSYVNALTEVGFRLIRIEEPLPVSDNAFFDREKRIPFFMVFKALRP
ncbi:MAG: class I SAM-dependent methyltransferase [Candidatus Thorarchaeota archaeon]